MINFTAIQMALSKNLPAILSGMAMATTAAAVVECASASFKAYKKLEKMHYESEEEPTPTEVVTALAPIYAKTAVLTAMAIFEIALAQKKNSDRISALTTLMAMKEQELQSTNEAVQSLFGEKKAEQVQKEMVKNDIQKDPPDRQDMDDTGTGDTIFRDGVLGGYFLADIEFVKHAFNEVGNLLNSSDEANIVSVNDLMHALNRDKTDIGDNLVWMPGDNLNVRIFQDEWGTASQDLYDTTEKEIKEVVWTIKYTMPHEIFDRDE